MSEQFSILVVCLGNVCRSPLAERLLRLRFRELLRDASDAVDVRSSGVRALVGDPMHAQSAAELLRLGGDPAGHAARQLTPALAVGADLVLTATRDQRSRVLEEAPRALKRAFTIRELAAIVTSEGFDDRSLGSPVELVARAASWRGSTHVEEYDVADPIQQSDEVHRRVADVLDVDCSAIAKAISAALLSDVSPR